MKKLFLLFTFVTSAFYLQAQSLRLPDVPSFESEADYKAAEPTILECIDWLAKHPLDAAERPIVSRYVLIWLTGCPYMTITLQSYVADLSKKNTDLLMLYMGGWTKFALENPDKADDTMQAEMAAMQLVIDYYNSGQKLKKDKKLKKIMDAIKEEGGAAWLKRQPR